MCRVKTFSIIGQNHIIDVTEWKLKFSRRSRLFYVYSLLHSIVAVRHDQKRKQPSSCFPYMTTMRSQNLSNDLDLDTLFMLFHSIHPPHPVWSSGDSDPRSEWDREVVLLWRPAPILLQKLVDFLLRDFLCFLGLSLKTIRPPHLTRELERHCVSIPGRPVLRNTLTRPCYFGKSPG